MNWRKLAYFKYFNFLFYFYINNFETSGILKIDFGEMLSIYFEITIKSDN